MFKPTLKRSKLQHNLVHSREQQPLNQNPKTNWPTFTQNLPPTSIIPEFLVQEPHYILKEQHHPIVCPLASQQRSYPAEIARGMNEEINQIEGRGIGYGHGLYWFHIKNKLILWTYNQMIPPTIDSKKIIEVNSMIYSIAIGQIKNVETKFSQDSLLLLTVGTASMIQLFQINPQTLQLKSLRCKLAVDGGQILQKVVFSSPNEIYYAGSSGFLTQVKFGDRGIQKKTVTPFKGYYNAQYYKYHDLGVENIVVGKSRVFCLVRKHQKESFMKAKLKQMWNFIRGKIRQYQPDKIITKEIHVYKKSQTKGLIFEKIIYSSEIEQKVITNYSYFQQKYTNINYLKEAFYLVSIFISQSRNEQCLGLITKHGYRLIINTHDDPFTFAGQPQEIDRNPLTPENQMNIVKECRQPVEMKEDNSLIYYSINGLTIFNNHCLYESGKAFQIVKLQQIPGHIIQVQEDSKEKTSPKWIIFDKKNFTILKKMEIKQLLLTYLSAKEDLLRDRSLKQYQIHHNQMQKIQRIGEYLGKAELCHAIYQLLSDFIISTQNSTTYSLSTDLKVLSSTELSDRELCTFQQWYYKVGKMPPNEGYTIDKEKIESFWKVLFVYQHQYDNMRMMIKNNDEGMGSCWWICLREQFYKIIQPILQWPPKQFMLNKNQKIKKKVIEDLQTMLEMLISKKKVKKRISSQLLFLRNRIEEQKIRKERQQSFHSGFINNSVTLTSDEIHPEIIDYPMNLTQSFEMLENLLIEILPKILSLIRYFEILAECDKTGRKPLPSFEDFLLEVRCRQSTKEILMEYFGKDAFEKSDLIKRFNREVPELLFENEIFFHRYFGEGNKLRVRMEELNTSLMAEKLTFWMLKKIDNQFQDYPSKYFQILLERLLYLTEKIQRIQIQIKAKQNQPEQLKTITSRADHQAKIKEKMLSSEEKQYIKNYIIEYFRSYASLTHKSKGDEFPHKEKQLDLMLNYILSYKNDFFISEIESFFREERMFPEKLFKLKGLTPDQIYPISATSQLLRIQGPQVMDSLTLMGIQETKPAFKKL